MLSFLLSALAAVRGYFDLRGARQRARNAYIGGVLVEMGRIAGALERIADANEQMVKVQRNRSEFEELSHGS